MYKLEFKTHFSTVAIVYMYFTKTRFYFEHAT